MRISYSLDQWVAPGGCPGAAMIPWEMRRNKRVLCCRMVSTAHESPTPDPFHVPAARVRGRGQDGELFARGAGAVADAGRGEPPDPGAGGAAGDPTVPARR